MDRFSGIGRVVCDAQAASANCMKNKRMLMEGRGLSATAAIIGKTRWLIMRAPTHRQIARPRSAARDR